MAATLAVTLAILLELVNLFSKSCCWGALGRLRENQEGIVFLLCQVYRERYRNCRMARESIPPLRSVLGGWEGFGRRITCSGWPGAPNLSNTRCGLGISLTGTGWVVCSCSLGGVAALKARSCVSGWPRLPMSCVLAQICWPCVAMCSLLGLAMS